MDGGALWKQIEYDQNIFDEKNTLAGALDFMGPVGTKPVQDYSLDNEKKTYIQ